MVGYAQVMLMSVVLVSGSGCATATDSEEGVALQSGVTRYSAAQSRRARVDVPKDMLAYYWFAGDCPELGLDIPQGMIDTGNAIMLSFIDDDKWEEGSMTMKLGAQAENIKKMKPSMYVAYSIGGQVGSRHPSLYRYLKDTPEDEIVKTILSWQHVDGIDWDLEPEDNTVAAGFGQINISRKIKSISQRVAKEGMHVTMAGMGSWRQDGGWSEFKDEETGIECVPLKDPCSKQILYGELIISGVVEKFGVMMYAPQQGTKEFCVQWMVSDWEKGAKGPAYPGGPPIPMEIKNKGVKPEQLAGGISGTDDDKPISTDKAAEIAKYYKESGFSSVIVWEVEPTGCKTKGWAVDNSKLPEWINVMAALRG